MASENKKGNSMYENFILHKKLPERMPAAEEKERLERYLQTRNEQDREKLIIHNLRLVKEVVMREYQFSQFEHEDLFSIGLKGLVDAVENYDPTMQSSFATFAYTCIKNEIGHIFTMANYAKRKGISLSIDTTPVTNLGSSDDELYLIDTLVDEGENVEEKIVETEYLKSMLSRVNEVLTIVGERNARVFSRYWGINGWQKATLRKISEDEGITYQRCEQIIRKILTRLRRKFKVKKAKKEFDDIEKE